ncbi:MAG: isopentenyl phosphate kinase family protein, partial [Anaerolineales bacterium]|nr:isopentenyl phosphate kinase family protein [Anaerolineales bacterium]
APRASRGMIFLKLGGSLITDKTGVEQVRPDVLARLAQEIQQARAARPALPLLVSHGSGSFGHVAAARHGTRGGVHTTEEWHGFAEVSAAAARLNSLVTAALLDAGVPAVCLQPSASAVCRDGQIVQLAHAPVVHALRAGLVPVVYGDVAFDAVRGGTIISTEEILAFLAGVLPERPSWLLLAGETAGVYDAQRQVIPAIHEGNFAAVAAALGGSRGTDVTGGMASKVRQMLALTAAQPGLAIRIFSGLQAGTLHRLLLDPAAPVGTRIAATA